MIVTDHQSHRVSVTVYGEFSIADYRQFEELVDFKVRFEGPIDLLFDLRQMIDYTLDVAWEELKFSRSHSNDFERIAVVTDSQWVTWSAWMSQIFVNSQMRIFDDVVEATGWLDSPGGGGVFR